MLGTGDGSAAVSAASAPAATPAESGSLPAIEREVEEEQSTVLAEALEKKRRELSGDLLEEEVISFVGSLDDEAHVDSARCLGRHRDPYVAAT